MFLQSSCPNYFFDVTLKKFQNMAKQKARTNGGKNFSYRISVPCFENPSHKFGCDLAKLIGRKFYFNLAIHYKSVKTASCFQLKRNTPSSFVSNVVYKSTCLRGTNLS